MKKAFQFFALSLVFAWVLSACSDACNKIDCVNGDCVEGNCNCSDNYLKDNDGTCTLMRNSLFVGRYSVEVTCNSGSSYTDSLDVVASTSPDRVILENYQTANDNIDIVINMSNDITIPQQNSNSGVAYSGQGTRLGSTLSFTLYSGSDTCQVTMTK